ncbi:MAG: IMP dehydrogenase, partial [Candidatus Saccharimonadales bacterium]
MICPEKEAFFDDMDKMHLALTYGDVLVDPGRGEGVDVAETDITSRFSRNVDLKIPMVSAAMDTVTTSDMAIAMAKLGGLGVIGNFLPAEEQKHQVRNVKMELTGLIDRPVTVT